MKVATGTTYKPATKARQRTPILTAAGPVSARLMPL